MIGRDQNIIWRAADVICDIKLPISFIEKDLTSIGKAATEYDIPIIPTGTDCRLYEKVKSDIEPCLKVDAIAMSAINARLLQDRVRVLGAESFTTFHISIHLIFEISLGKNP
jgi:hypothetical protein